MKITTCFLMWLIMQTVFCGESSAEIYAKKFGKQALYESGLELFRAISGPGDLDIAAFRGKKIAILAATAFPGGTNDLQTSEGYYIRIVTKDNKDLRPHSVHWVVLVSGTVQQVLKGNKLLVMEVMEEDWHIVETF